MASNKCVTVLTPNGRRQTVKVTPNTTILQIIEEVCKKQGYNPEDYDIKHHKQILDTSATLRFSGLPNNALLELLATTRTRAESEVTLGIHFENGNRILGTFTPSNTLYEVLTELSPDDLEPEKNSVIIYMRREIYGIESFQNVDLRSLGLTNGRAMLRLIHRAPEDLKTQANISTPIPPKPVEEKPYIRKLQRVESPVRAVPVPEHTENDIPHTNIVNDEKKESFVAPKQEYVHKPTQKNLVNLIKTEKKKQIVKKTEPKQINQSRKIEDEFVFLGERNAMAFSLETAQSVPSEDLPEDFFDLTIDDAKKLLRDIKRRRLELENGPLLTSALRNLEESKRQLRQLNAYKKSIIRVQFPDRTVLQGTFLPVEDIDTVIQFVREYLEDKTLDFYLYTTPPKNVLKKESRLIEIGCVPGALLHFGTNIIVENGKYLRSDVVNKFTSSSVASLAASKMRQQATRPVPAEESDTEDVNFTSNDVNVGASTSSDVSSTYVDYDKPSTSAAPEKVPKWFKPTK